MVEDFLERARWEKSGKFFLPVLYVINSLFKRETVQFNASAY